MMIYQPRLKKAERRMLGGRLTPQEKKASRGGGDGKKSVSERSCMGKTKKDNYSSEETIYGWLPGESAPKGPH